MFLVHRRYRFPPYLADRVEGKQVDVTLSSVVDISARGRPSQSDRSVAFLVRSWIPHSNELTPIDHDISRISVDEIGGCGITARLVRARECYRNPILTSLSSDGS